MRSVFLIALLLLSTREASAASPATSVPAGHHGYRLTTWVAPSYFHGVHGMAVAADGSVYAGDILGQTVWRIPPGSHQPVVFVPAPAGMADDVAIGLDGSIVWTSILNGFLYRRSPDGVITTLASGLPGINSVGFAADGRLFASQLEGVDRLFEIVAGAPPKLMMEHAGGLNGFQIVNNLMYAPQGSLKRVITLDLTNNKATELANGFQWPTGVKVDSRGRIYAVDLTAGALYRIHPGAANEKIAQFLPGIDNLAIDHQDRILVSSPGDNTIFRVDPDTRRVEPWIEGRLSVPGGVAVAADGSVLVADTFGFKAVSPRTRRVSDLGRRVGEPIVAGLNVHACEGAVTLSHWYESSVRLLDSTARVTKRRITGLAKPQDAILLPDHSLLIAETGKHRLARALVEGDTAETFMEGFDAPAGLTCAKAGKVYVTDAAAGTVSEIAIATRQRRLVASGLNRPEGIALAPDSALYVAEVGARRLLKLRPDGGTPRNIVDLPQSLDPPPGIPLPWVITGVAVADDGRIYVSSPATTALYMIEPPRSRSPQR